jgi:hypothetical protein
MNSVAKQVKSHGRKLLGVVLLGTATVAGAAPATWNATGTAFTFDNITLQSYSNIDVTGGTAFTTRGFLNLFSFQNGATLTQLPNVGITGGSPYSLYVAFTGTGTQSPTVPSFGSFSTLNYTLFQAAGVTTFVDSNSDGIFEASGGAPTALGTGSLIAGTSVTTLSPAGATAAADTRFVPDAGAGSFFVDPNVATVLTIATAFTATNTVTNIIDLGGGNVRVSINGGGGNATVSPIPEPGVYAMMLSGLGLVGFAARRRKSKVC